MNPRRARSPHRSGETARRGKRADAAVRTGTRPTRKSRNSAATKTRESPARKTAKSAASRTRKSPASKPSKSAASRTRQSPAGKPSKSAAGRTRKSPASKPSKSAASRTRKSPANKTRASKTAKSAASKIRKTGTANTGRNGGKARSTQPTVSAELSRRARDIDRRLARAIPKPRVALNHENRWQLLVATILSAQSTDQTINRITPALFARYPTPGALGQAPQAEVEELVKSSGFFRNKAKSIRSASAVIAERFGGTVPNSIDEMVQLPGVARKTANVVLTAYGIASGIVIDTHARRVAQRLDLSANTDPVKIEADLCPLFPQAHWVALSHRIILHGRHLCTARGPDCVHCPLNEVCPSRDAEPEGTWTRRADGEAEHVAAAVARTRGEA